LIPVVPRESLRVVAAKQGPSVLLFLSNRIWRLACVCPSGVSQTAEQVFGVTAGWCICNRLLADKTVSMTEHRVESLN
jgi:hypothetical protein